MSSTLVLNASYECLGIVSRQRAMVLVITDRADLVEDTGEVWHSQHAEFPVPSVIRLKVFVKVPFRVTSPLNRRAVLVRDNHTCAFCGKTATTIDHVVPRSRGGPHRWENVVAACRKCNSQKDDKLLSELGWKLAFTPRVPHGTVWLILGIAELDPAWEPYLGVAVA